MPGGVCWGLKAEVVTTSRRDELNFIDAISIMPVDSELVVKLTGLLFKVRTRQRLSSLIIPIGR